MDKTQNLNLPYILPSQAQKHVTHNEAIRALDAMLHLAVLSRAIKRGLSNLPARLASPLLKSAL